MQNFSKRARTRRPDVRWRLFSNVNDVYYRSEIVSCGRLILDESSITLQTSGPPTWPSSLWRAHTEFGRDAKPEEASSRTN